MGRNRGINMGKEDNTRTRKHYFLYQDLPGSLGGIQFTTAGLLSMDRFTFLGASLAGRRRSGARFVFYKRIGLEMLLMAAAVSRSTNYNTFRFPGNDAEHPGPTETALWQPVGPREKN